MSRSKKRNPRDVVADSVYGSELIGKFINMMMIDGKKEVSELIVLKAIEKIKSKIESKYGNVNDGFKEIILAIGPTVQTKVRRIGGANYQVPVDVPDYRRLFLGMKILIKVFRKKSGVDAITALSSEMANVMEEKGDAIKERITIQKMALANKAYSHLA